MTGSPIKLKGPRPLWDESLRSRGATRIPGADSDPAGRHGLRRTIRRREAQPSAPARSAG